MSEISALHFLRQTNSFLLETPNARVRPEGRGLHEAIDLRSLCLRRTLRHHQVTQFAERFLLEFHDHQEKTHLLSTLPTASHSHDHLGGGC